MNEQPSQWQQAEVLVRNLVAAVKGLFTYVPSYIVSLLTAVLSDVFMTGFAVTGVAVGFAASSWIIGVAVFFGFYSFARVWGNHTNAVVQAGHEVGYGVLGAAEKLDRPRYITSPESEQEIEAPPVP